MGQQQSIKQKDNANYYEVDLVYFFSGEQKIKISDALVINEILITVVRFKNKSVRIILCFFVF